MKILKESPNFTFLFLLILILLNGIGATLPIPNLVVIAEYYNFSMIGLIEGMFIIVSTISLLVWGYGVDKLERKKLMILGTLIWITATIMIFIFPEMLFIYIIGRFGMAIGLSVLAPLAYSILADLAIYNKRGLFSSGLNLAWVGSSASGILIGGFFSSQWYLSFGVIALLGFIILFWQLLIQIPLRGCQEPALSKIKDLNYHWHIELKQIPIILKSKTILWLLIQGTFALIPGTIFTYWLVSFLSSENGIDIKIENASIIAIIIASGRALGYPFFGKIGDYCTNNYGSSNIRAKIASLCMGAQAIFFFLAFLVLNSTILTFIFFSLFFWLGSFIGAASGPNRTSLLFNVSLPEQRGSLGALFSLTDQFGEIIGIIFSTVLLEFIGYREIFSISLFFYLLAAIAWFFSVSHIDSEEKGVQIILELRAKELIDNV